MPRLRAARARKLAPLTVCKQSVAGQRVAEPAPFIGQVSQPFSKRRIWRMLRLVVHPLRIRVRNLARPPFRGPKQGFQAQGSLALHSGRYHFLDSSSGIAAVPRICSASRRVNLAFHSQGH